MIGCSRLEADKARHERVPHALGVLQPAGMAEIGKLDEGGVAGCAAPPPCRARDNGRASRAPRAARVSLPSAVVSLSPMISTTGGLICRIHRTPAGYRSCRRCRAVARDQLLRRAREHARRTSAPTARSPASRSRRNRSPAHRRGASSALVFSSRASHWSTLMPRNALRLPVLEPDRIDQRQLLDAVADTSAHSASPSMPPVECADERSPCCDAERREQRMGVARPAAGKCNW